MTGDRITIAKQIASTYPYQKQAEALGDTAHTMFTLDWLDAFTVLALLIPVTENGRLGTSFTIIPYRHPLETAHVVATLDVASGERIILGAGIGWRTEEFELLGILFYERAALTREYVAIMKEVWSKDAPRFSGNFVEIPDLRFYTQTATSTSPTDLGLGARPHVR
jgi:alkanesulfonate monooxygenase SsuD/methylene tetrahydromethanopterin reductase-like flavin-dependent oxidoreductase (luciferase family)